MNYIVFCVTIIFAASVRAITSESVSPAIAIDTSIINSEVTSSVSLRNWCGIVSVDGEQMFSSTNDLTFVWQPLRLGAVSLRCDDSVWGVQLTASLSVTALAFRTSSEPNPPMAKDDRIQILPASRSFSIGMDGNSVITSGEGTWTAATSDSWITLGATSGSAGTPVIYVVSANTGVGERVGYIYVSGHVHKVIQKGYEAPIDPQSGSFECDGGSGDVEVDAPGNIEWVARPNVNWISVSPTSGKGPGVVSYQIAPYYAVAERIGSITIGAQTFSVKQAGQRIVLSEYESSIDYFAHTITVSVTALNSEQWSVEANEDWLSVIDQGPVCGCGEVTIMAEENPGWLPRSGLVRIGSKELVVKQEGCSAPRLSISPKSATVDSKGSNSVVIVTATPDLPWFVKSSVNWIVVSTTTKSNRGDGKFSYTVLPNSELNERTGEIRISSEDISLPTKVFNVKQSAATATVTPLIAALSATGGVARVEVEVPNFVEWNVSQLPDWLTVLGSSEYQGSAVVTLVAAENQTLLTRKSQICIAGESVIISQQPHEIALGYSEKQFSVDGGMGILSINPGDGVAWTVASSDTSWIQIYSGESGSGSGEVIFIVSAYYEENRSRTGMLYVGEYPIYITQRHFNVTIDSITSEFSKNGGEGEFSVIAPTGAEYSTIVTADWIELTSCPEVGSGKVSYRVQENLTGKDRTGKIIVAGEVYVVKQHSQSPYVDVQIDWTLSTNSIGTVSLLGATPAVGDLQIPAKVQGREVTKIWDDAFRNCTALTSVVIPEGVQWLGWGCFLGCVSLESITIPSSVTSTSAYVFYGCEALKTVELPSDLSILSEYTFMNCSNLVSATLPQRLTVIGTKAFMNCTALSSIVIPSEVIEIRLGAFCDCISLTSVTLPASVTAIGDKIFGSCSSLTNVFAEGNAPNVLCNGKPFLGVNPCCTLTVHRDAAGWDDDGDGLWQGLKIAYAEDEWIGVHFDLNGAEETVDARAVLKCGMLGELPQPERSGYDFVGWFTSAIGGIQVNADTVVNEDTILYAHWDWIPTGGTVSGSDVGATRDLNVPANWVSQYLTGKYGVGKKEHFRQKFGDNLSVALVQSTTKANGAKMYVWEDYIAGTDPTDSNSVFTAKVRMDDGFPIIEWEPNLNENGNERVYTVFGKADLRDAWHSPTNGTDRFFKVSVAMPEGNVITLSLGGGSCDADPLVVSPGDPLGTLPEPTRDGYVFDGWYTSEQGGDKVTAQTIAVEGMTIYAHWKNLGEGLVHRWSFNGNLNDLVGSLTAVAVGSVTAGEKQYTLAGGTRDSSYIDLGDNILPTGANGATIELWATRRGAQKYSRVIDIGSTIGNYLFWSWQESDSVDNDSCGVYALIGTSDRHSGVPFVEDKEYHLSIAIKPVSTHWEVVYVKRDVSTASVVSTVTISSEGSSWTPKNLGQSNCWLGHSQWGDNRDACASYNEVRIWNRALTDDELTKSAKAGPDKLAL